jgi:hypothetical protein
MEFFALFDCEMTAVQTECTMNGLPHSTPDTSSARKGGVVWQTWQQLGSEQHPVVSLRQMVVFSVGEQGSCPRTFRKTGRWREIAAGCCAELLTPRCLSQLVPTGNSTKA